MTTFDERENAFEKEFIHDQDLQFKVHARRNKLVGLWAAEKMGLSGKAAEDFAKTVVIADLEEEGDDDVFRKLRAELDKAAEAISDEEIRSKMDECLIEAKRQIREGDDGKDKSCC